MAGLFLVLAGLLAAIGGCKARDPQNPPSTGDASPARCEVRLADERGNLGPVQVRDCAGLRDPAALNGQAMRLISADAIPLSRVTQANRKEGHWQFPQAEGLCLAGLYVRLGEVFTLLGELGWPMEQEEPLAVIYPFDPPGLSIPAQWRIDLSFPKRALLVPALCREGEQEPVLAPGLAARAAASLLLLRHYPDRSEAGEEEKDRRFARNARLLLTQGFGLYIGAVAARTLSYMDPLTADGEHSPTRIPPVSREMLGAVVLSPTDAFNPAPLSMNLAACLWEARSSVREEDRHLVDREAVAGWYSAEALKAVIPDPIPVLNHLAVSYTPGPRGAFCACLKERIQNLALRTSACLPYTHEGHDE